MNCNMVVNQPDCPHGCVCVENEFHLFWKCQVAKSIWFASPWSIRWDFIQSEDISAFVDCLMNPEKFLPVVKADRDKFFLFASLTLDHIWGIRNARLHEGKVFDISSSMQVILARFGDFLLPSSQQGSSEVSGIGYNPLPNTRSLVTPFSVYCDAGVINGAACVAAVVKDPMESIVAVQISKERIDVPEAAEAYAILQAMQMAIEHGWVNLRCYSDAQAVIQCWFMEFLAMLTGQPRALLVLSLIWFPC